MQPNTIDRPYPGDPCDRRVEFTRFDGTTELPAVAGETTRWQRPQVIHKRLFDFAFDAQRTVRIHYVEARGDEFPAGSGGILATILEREDSDTEAILQGFVETISDPSFTILGVTIQTGPATVFRDENDAVISSIDFFDRLAPNSLVKAKGMESADTVITAEEVEFELEF